MQEQEILNVNMLGEFSLTCGTKSISDADNRSKKLWLLLEYLITFRGKTVSQSELIDLLWPEDERSNPANTLKTLLHRARAMVGELELGGIREVITYRAGAYGWNDQIPMSVDAEEFEKLCHTAGDARTPKSEKCELLLKATQLYRGPFLPKNSSEPWVVPIHTYYHAMYLQAARDASALLFSAERWGDVIAICQHAVELDPYDEVLHQYLIRAFLQNGNQQTALNHYERVTDLFFNRFGITPSEEFTALYREIKKNRLNAEMDLNVIKGTIKEKGEAAGAFYCEYEFFKEIYRLEARAAERTGQAAYLCLISVTDSQNLQPNQKVLVSAMAKLQITIQTSLRRGDVFTRFSSSQYLILLPTTNYENGEMVLTRIAKKFRRDNPKAPITLRHKLQPLEPLEVVQCV